MKRVRTEKRSYGSWATGRDVAAAAKVSLITVSRAFNSPGRLAPETLRRVKEAAEKVGYIPNAVAGELSSRRSRVVAAVVPTLSHSNFARTIEGLVAGLSKERYELLLSSSEFSLEREEEIVGTFLERRPDAIVLIGSDHTSKLRKLLKHTQVPVLELWALDRPVIDMAVGFSDYQAMRAMTQHIVDSGRQRIGYIDFFRSGVARYVDRQRGFVEAVNGAGLDPTLIARSPTGKDYESGRQCLSDLLEREPGMDAIVGCTDIHAAGAIFECATRGIAIPDRLAVAGFGDFEIAASIQPPLTTVRSHAYEMGRQAADMLLSRINGEEIRLSPLDVGFELLVRSST